MKALVIALIYYPLHTNAYERKQMSKANYEDKFRFQYESSVLSHKNSVFMSGSNKNSFTIPELNGVI